MFKGRSFFQTLLLRTLLLGLLCLGALPPASSQLPPLHRYTFRPAPPNALSAAQVADLNAQAAALNVRVAALNAQVTALSPVLWPGNYANPRTDGSGLIFAHSIGAPFNGAINGPNGAYGMASGWRQTLQGLKSYGVDGIAEDMFTAGPLEKDNLTTLFQAANQENAASLVNGVIPSNGHGVSKCYILPTPDFSTIPEDSATMSALATLLIPFLADPACATYQGHPVLSTYTGDGGGVPAVTAVFAPLLAQINAGLHALGKPSVSFLPGWGGSGGYAAAAEIAAVPGSIGAWQFNNPVTPLGLSSPLPAQESLAASVQAATLPSGKAALWMQGVWPLGYWKALGHTPAEGKLYNEMHGMQGLAVNMASAISVQRPFWLEALTLDDLQEGGAFGSDGASEYLPGHWNQIYPTSTPDFYQANAGLHTAMDFYFEWWRTGHQPVITSDTLIVSNRTQLAAASYAPASDPTGPLTSFNGAASDPGALTDTVDVMTLLTATGQVEVSGVTPSPTLLPAPAGISQLTFPVTQAGTPVVTLLKNGQVRRQVTGHPIAAAAALVNMNPASYASVPGISFTLAGSTTIPVDSAGILVRGTSGSSPLAVFGLVATDESVSPPVVITQNDLHGPAGTEISRYIPALGDALSVGRNSASSYAVFTNDPTEAGASPGTGTAPGAGLPAVVVPGYANNDNPYYALGKQTASVHWKVTCQVKRITNDPSGEAGPAMVSSTGHPQPSDYQGAEVAATISVYGAATAFNLSNIAPVSGDVRTSRISVPLNSLALGEVDTVTIENNNGALTATCVPGNQQP